MVTVSNQENVSVIKVFLVQFSAFIYLNMDVVSEI